MGIVYKWINIENGMYYIGSTNNKRSYYKGSGKYFKRAYRKSPESFFREVLYDGEDYIKEEERILNELNCAADSMSYNLKNTATGAAIGENHHYRKNPMTQEQKDKISKSLKGRVFTEETRKKMSVAQSGNEKCNKKVYCDYNKKTYKSLKYCAEDLGIHYQTAKNHIHGKTKNKYSIKYI